jgi:hypothetical protein
LPALQLRGRVPSRLRCHHIARHTPYRFQCAFGCSKHYTRVGHLGTRHLKKKRKEGGHKILGGKYIKFALLKIAGSPTPPPNATLPISCPFCDLRFPNNQVLIEHLRFRHT